MNILLYKEKMPAMPDGSPALSVPRKDRFPTTIFRVGVTLLQFYAGRTRDLQITVFRIDYGAARLQARAVQFRSQKSWVTVELHQIEHLFLSLRGKKMSINIRNQCTYGMSVRGHGINTCRNRSAGASSSRSCVICPDA